MMRSLSRIEPILELVKDIWTANPDLRLMQLLENANMNFHTEDVNDVVYKLCYHYSMPFRHYAMWGVLRGKTHTFKRLTDLGSEHLRNIVKNCRIDKYLEDIIYELLEERGEFKEEVKNNAYYVDTVEVEPDVYIPYSSTTIDKSKKETTVEFTTNWV